MGPLVGVLIGLTSFLKAVQFMMMMFMKRQIIIVGMALVAERQAYVKVMRFRDGLRGF